MANIGGDTMSQTVTNGIAAAHLTSPNTEENVILISKQGS